MIKIKEIGLYFHIPFCVKKCDYCDFVSYPGKEKSEDKYFDALYKELESYDLSKYNVTTIYIGGGTPSYVNEKNIENLITKIKSKLEKNRTLFKDIEITIEVNPGTVTEKKMNLYKNIGINRLSIGLQTTNNKLLKEIGRIHTYEDFLNTYNMAKKAKFDNINVDLMIGLPKQKIEDIKSSISVIKNLKPNHVSVYSLIVEEGTKLEKRINDGELNLPNEETERNMYWYVKNRLEEIGFSHYEISNFAIKGFESKHNLNCWEQKEYIGFGIASHSYLDGIRYSNTSNLEKYVEAKEYFFNEKELINENVRVIQEVQNTEIKEKEYMMLGLRKINGIKISEFKKKFIDNPIYVFKKELNDLVKDGLIKVDNDNIYLTNKGLDLANQVWQNFI